VTQKIKDPQKGDEPKPGTNGNEPEDPVGGMFPPEDGDNFPGDDRLFYPFIETYNADKNFIIPAKPQISGVDRDGIRIVPEGIP
jgi:hypothetical protein